MYEKYKEHDLKVYGGYVNDKEVLSCSSGGIGTALAREMIRRGGYVIGVAYSKDFYKAEYIVARSEADLERLKGSKYIDVANINKIYTVTKEYLENNKQILFFGLPCVIGALRKNLQKEYDNLITVELICNGPTYSDIHFQYVKYLEKKFKSKIVDFSVRYKKEKWSPSYLYAKFENGKEFIKEFYQTEYGFAMAIYGKSACYKCKFKGNNRQADLMIGDFWGISSTNIEYNELGTSVVFAHTRRGDQFINETKGITLFETSFENAVRNNLMVIQSKEEHRERKKFEDLFKKKGLIYACKKTSFRKAKIKRAIKHLIEHQKK